jgi:glycosyltransferase involved in cell wall biosynthesis
MNDLIFVSMEDWDEVWRRNQFVCAELARRHPEMKILFVGVPRNVWRFAKRGDFGALVRSPITKAAGFGNITITRALRAGLERFEWGVRLNQLLARRHVQKLARRLGMKKPVLWLNPHWAVHMIGRMDESQVVYDVTDDWIERDQPAWLAEQVRRQDAEMCAKAGAVIVCSQKLFEGKQKLAGDRVHLIPNGVDAAHYEMVLAGTTPLPAAAAEWEKPVFGYTGTVHPDRVDVQLVEDVAKQLKRGTLVFVGPNHLPVDQRERLVKTGRVKFHPPVPYSEIPSFMRAFDVCMTPHRTSAFVQSLQPIKLWEYLAAGKPIVATDVAGFRDFPELVRIARSADEFVKQLLVAMTEGTLLSGKRQAVARENSWQSRVDAIEKVLGS